MSKVVGITGLLLVGAAVSAGGMYLFKMNNFDSILPTEVKKFEEDGHAEGCVQSLFPGLEKPTETSDTSDNTKLDSNFLSDKDKADTEGCLVINWNRQDFGSGNSKKGKGSFRFLGSVKHTKTNNGFVVFAVADPVNTSKKFKWTGVAYALKKGDKQTKGTAIKKVEIKNGTSEGKEVEFKDKFPKVNITGLDTNGWGFDETEDTNICENGDCKETDKKTETSFEGYGTWKGETGTNTSSTLGGGSDKLEEWGKETFGEDNGKIGDVVKDMKGKGENKVIGKRA